MSKTPYGGCQHVTESPNICNIKSFIILSQTCMDFILFNLLGVTEELKWLINVSIGALNTKFYENCLKIIEDAPMSQKMWKCSQ